MMGLWNKENKQIWLRQADFVLLEGQYRTANFQQELQTAGYVEIATTDKVENCREDSEIFIYQQKY